ncbi:FAD-dependent monooxygenase [Deinococcus sp. HMF7604]|uniref:FAD-dependent monooxygenase n=1 Tax=Deinococcus betulae TaxID=2873312 RepID=UPI001CCC7805|nr:FAD-dependent monooxygenase [Deinococcus betulae]MBZ9749311.1 FAD-dependent monooxygenase [Deinococcus betulae]
MTRSVLIVGAGIGGLALAQRLLQTGIQVRLIEKVPAWRPVGAGLILSVNALRVLERLGLAKGAAHRGQRLTSAQVTDAAGRPLQTVLYPQSSAGGAVALHRAALQNLLSRGVESQIQFGTTLRALHQDAGGVEVGLSDGSEGRFEAVVGADGLHSSVRQLVFGDVPKHYAGYTSWRFLVDVPQTGPHDYAVEMWGRGCRLGLVPIGQGQLYGYVTANAPERERPTSVQTDTIQELQALCRPFGGLAPAVTAQLRADLPVIRTDIHEVRLPRWVRGRVALLGDAAHAMTPNLGQGAAMSLEDAWVLGGQLATSEAPAALARYEQLRQARVNRVQTQSRQLGRAGQLEATWLRAVRDVGLRLSPPSLARRSARDLFEVALD